MTTADRALLVLATGLGLGYAPVAPGTVGSLLGLPLAWGIQQLPPWGQPVVAVALFLVGVPICAAGARLLGSKDPGAVVFDEIAAFSVLFLGVQFSAVSGLLGFLLFRAFDVSKPWPVERLERLPGGWGIMADDFAAALLAGILLRCVDWIFPLV